MYVQTSKDTHIHTHTHTHTYIYIYIYIYIVKLNLFNYALTLFGAKFACNLAFRNPVFR